MDWKRIPHDTSMNTYMECNNNTRIPLRECTTFRSKFVTLRFDDHQHMIFYDSIDKISTSPHHLNIYSRLGTCISKIVIFCTSEEIEWFVNNVDSQGQERLPVVDQRLMRLEDIMMVLLDMVTKRGM